LEHGGEVGKGESGGTARAKAGDVDACRRTHRVLVALLIELVVHGPQLRARPVVVHKHPFIPVVQLVHLGGRMPFVVFSGKIQTTK